MMSVNPNEWSLSLTLLTSSLKLIHTSKQKAQQDFLINFIEPFLHWHQAIYKHCGSDMFHTEMFEPF